MITKQTKNSISGFHSVTHQPQLEDALRPSDQDLVEPDFSWVVMLLAGLEGLEGLDSDLEVVLVLGLRSWLTSVFSGFLRVWVMLVGRPGLLLVSGCSSGAEIGWLRHWWRSEVFGLGATHGRRQDPMKAGGCSSTTLSHPALLIEPGNCS